MGRHLIVRMRECQKRRLKKNLKVKVTTVKKMIQRRNQSVKKPTATRKLWIKNQRRISLNERKIREKKRELFVEGHLQLMRKRRGKRKTARKRMMNQGRKFPKRIAPMKM